ncbi:MAG: glycosyltransferase [Myxococcota bacterium]|nr:glycosyltransferase [Myxococcota bacterium]
MTLGMALGSFLTGWALWLLGAALATVSKRQRLGTSALAGASVQPKPRKVLIIRPCAGNESYLIHCLQSIGYLEGTCQVNAVFAVSDPNDLALPAIAAAVDHLADRGIKAHTEVALPLGPNRKVANLAASVPEDAEIFDAIVCADSNVDLTGFDLDGLLTALERQSSPGAVWVPFIETAQRKQFGNRVSEAVLHGSWQTFGLISGIDPQAMVGKLFAIRPHALRAIGGFGVLSNYLGEDMELSRQLRQSGYDVSPYPGIAHTLVGPKACWDTMARLRRWTMVVKAQRPGLLLAYPGMFCAGMLIPVLAVISAALGVHWGLVALAPAGLARLIVGLGARHFCGMNPRISTALVDAVLADITLLLVFVGVLFSRTVIWRGVSLKVDKTGRLVQG